MSPWSITYLPIKVLVMMNLFMGYWLLIYQIISQYFVLTKFLNIKLLSYLSCVAITVKRTKVHFSMIWHRWIGRMYILQATCSALILYSIRKWLIYMTIIFLGNLSQRGIIQESHGWVLVFERQLKRKANCIINWLKSNACELRKSMYNIVINYGNWWELRKRNSMLTESWKTK